MTDHSAEPPDGEDLASRIADILESVAVRIRRLTVDRVAKVITIVTLGLVAITMVMIAFVFVLIGMFRISGELVRKVCDCGASMEYAYAIVGGLFLLLGALMWSKRTHKETE